MAEHQIRFTDGAAYERMMGVWSRLVGEIFLDWLAPRPKQRWIDVGCGSGAFTELLVERCNPIEVHGIDPSEQQLAFAHTRPAARLAQFRRGDAMALPFADDSFDAAVMALVIFFVSDPAKGVAEMLRVVRPGGVVSSYAWDISGGGFPGEPLRASLFTMGITPPGPPNAAASRMDILRTLWRDAGLDAIETREITVSRTFADFEDFWTTSLSSPTTGPLVAAMSPADAAQLKASTRARLPTDADGRITYASRANAITGRVPMTA